eukprot:10524424-Ditylum_brightwellii.AAC.1
MLKQQVKKLKALLLPQKTGSNCTSDKKWFSQLELNVLVNKSTKATPKKAFHWNNLSNEEEANAIDNFDILSISSDDDNSDKGKVTAIC